MRIKERKVYSSRENEINAYEIINDNGITVEALNLGGIITKILTPDGEGKFENIVLGYKDIAAYFTTTAYKGAIIGRTAGRIADGKVDIEGKCYSFFKNNGNNTLHGGKEGFNLRLWDVEPIKGDSELSLRMTYLSRDGEENYPGNLIVTVIYTLNNNNEFIIEYKAITDQRTLVNLTNHSYFNLSGGKRDILGHILYINADNICELDKESIATGKLIPVEGTAFDFRTAKPVGRDINDEDKQLKNTGGYDHPWILNKDGEVNISFYDPGSKRAMDIKTNRGVVVFYSMNAPDGLPLSNGKNAEFRCAACFETQNPPIGKKQVFADESMLDKGEEYYQKTVFKFYTR